MMIRTAFVLLAFQKKAQKTPVKDIEKVKTRYKLIPSIMRSPMRKSARVENEIIKSSGNVFSDLGFDDAEAQVLALRADLMGQLEKASNSQKTTPVRASKLDD